MRQVDFRLDPSAHRPGIASGLAQGGGRPLTGGDAYSRDAYSLPSRGANPSRQRTSSSRAGPVPLGFRVGSPPRSQGLSHLTRASATRRTARPNAWPRLGQVTSGERGGARSRATPSSRRAPGSWTGGASASAWTSPSADTMSQSNAPAAAADSDARFDHLMRLGTKMPRSAQLRPSSRPSTAPTNARANVQVKTAITMQPRTCIR